MKWWVFLNDINDNFLEAQKRFQMALDSRDRGVSHRENLFHIGRVCAMQEQLNALSEVLLWGELCHEEQCLVVNIRWLSGKLTGPMRAYLHNVGLSRLDRLNHVHDIMNHTPTGTGKPKPRDWKELVRGKSKEEQREIIEEIRLAFLDLQRRQQEEKSKVG